MFLTSKHTLPIFPNIVRKRLKTNLQASGFIYSTAMLLRRVMNLRTFNLNDAARVTELLQDEEISKWTSNIPFPYSEQHAIEWIERNDRSSFAIEVNSVVVGCISYWVNSDSELEVGYWLGKSYWGQGFCSEALSMMLSLPNFPATSKIVAKVIPENIGSQRVLLKNGFSYISDCNCQKQDVEIDAKFYIKEITI